ncbi:MAG TPA: anti-sigma factor [Vicinamibacterales bacterium]|jgi:anti-sigma factor RsiW
MHEQWTDQLSDYLDGELPGDEQDALETHLGNCEECRSVLNELKRVVQQAQSVEARPPHTDLWTGIAARLDETPSRAESVVARLIPRQPRRFAFTLPQLAAAAALLIAVSGGAAWKLAQARVTQASRYANADTSGPATASRGVEGGVGGGKGTPPAAVVVPAADSAAAPDGGRVVAVGLADAQYDAAVADLEKALKDGRGHLDPSTVSVVEHNLQIIDLAIDQARQALGADPANSYLNGYLVEARRRKLDLLRRAAALTTETN